MSACEHDAMLEGAPWAGLGWGVASGEDTGAWTTYSARATMETA